MTLSEALAHLDIIHLADNLFGVFWSRPFWKKDKPANALIENMSGQGSVSIGWSRTISGYDGEATLARYGVRVWGRNFDEENFYIKVSKEQAGWAYYLLQRAGFPLSTPPPSDAYPTGVGPMPLPWGTGRRSAIMTLADTFTPERKPTQRRKAKRLTDRTEIRCRGRE